MRAAFAVLASTTLSCALVVSFDRYDADVHAADAGVRDGSVLEYPVAGTVTGLDDKTQVKLVLNGTNTLMAGNGRFDFPAVVPDGTNYEVTIGEQPKGFTCAATQNTGVIDAAPVGDVAVLCRSSDAVLDELSLSIGELSPKFSSAIVAYTAAVRLQSVFPPIANTTLLTAKPHTPGARVTIDGVSATTATITLTLAPRAVKIVVTSPDDSARTEYVVQIASRVLDELEPANADLGGALALDGDSLAVGSSGAVYIYARKLTTWSAPAKIVAPDAGAADFARAVALRGNTLVVGASGAVYVYAKAGTAWEERDVITNSVAGPTFGSVLAFDEDTLAIGAPGESSNGTDENDTSLPGAGAVFVHTRTGSTFTRQAYVKASDPRANAGFGSALALETDTLVAGAPHAGSDDSGTAYVYGRASGVWGPQGTLKAPAPAAGDRFGEAVSLSADVAGAGAPGDTGSVHVFTRSEATWTHQTTVKASHPRLDSSFGAALSLSGDRLVVGSPRESSSATFIDGDESDTTCTDCGAAFVFLRSGNTWPQRAYVKPNVARPGARFGTTVSVSGGSIAVSAPGVGTAYVY
jgi:hypothetical protein